MLKNLYVIVGRSGSGKTTIVEMLNKKYEYVQAESYTDRPKRRPDETGHVYITKEEFDKLENPLLPTVFSGARYAMTKEIMDSSDIIVLDPKGIRDLQADYTERNIYIIGLYCNKETLADRMAYRGDKEEKIQERLEHDDAVFNGMEELCDIMLNNKNINHTITAVAAFIHGMEKITD